MSASKSLITNNLVPYSTRSLYNPISNNGANNTNNELALINQSFFNTLNLINSFYIKNAALKQYEKIPGNYQKYVGLYVILQNVINKTSSPQLKTLFRIAQNSLTSAINSYNLYSNNLYLQLDIQNLNARINDALAEKNNKLVEMANTSGTITMKRSFKLAAVFNNYILIFGLPVKGVGFDPVKLSFLADVLQKKGIDPYK
jgi:hypothetical protein